VSTLKTIKLQNPSGASSNIDLGVGGEVLIGSATTTGTASQRLQVTGGAYVSGNLGVGATNPTVGQLQISSGPVIIGSASSTGTASQTLQVTGGAYVSGNIGIGTTNPGAGLDVVGAAFIRNNDGLLRFIGANSSNYIQSGLTLTSGSTASLIFSNIFAAAEYGRFSSTGDGRYFKATSDGNYVSSSSSYHEFYQGALATTLNLYASNANYANRIIDAVAVRSANTAYSFLVTESANFGDFEHHLRGDGNAFADGTWSGGGADYAEMFEWEDGNPDNEDRRGYSVSLVGNKIKIAEEGDEIIGVISGNPSVIGDTAWNKWSEKYLRDDFGSYIMEPHNVLEWTDEDGKEHSYEDWNLPEGIVVPDDAVIKTHDEKGNRFTHRKLNPDYNPELEYVSREDRPEWDAVGMMGKLRLRKGQPVRNTWIKMRDISASVEEWLVR
jgi:hypothetical protein